MSQSFHLLLQRMKAVSLLAMCTFQLPSLMYKLLGACCRDLKLDNTLMSDDQPPRIKLCDFGFAKEWQSDAQMFTHIG